MHIEYIELGLLCLS